MRQGDSFLFAEMAELPDEQPDSEDHEGDQQQTLIFADSIHVSYGVGDCKCSPRR